MATDTLIERLKSLNLTPCEADDCFLLKPLLRPSLDQGRRSLLHKFTVPQKVYLPNMRNVVPTTWKTSAFRASKVGVTMFDTVVEGLLRQTASQMHSMTAQESKQLLSSTNKHLEGLKFKAQLRSGAKTFPDRVTRYTINQLQPNTVSAGTSSSTNQQQADKGDTQTTIVQSDAAKNQTHGQEQGVIDITDDSPNITEKRNLGKQHATNTYEVIPPKTPLKKIKTEKP